jgi:hypothetical protein
MNRSKPRWEMNIFGFCAGFRGGVDQGLGCCEVGVVRKELKIGSRVFKVGSFGPARFKVDPSRFEVVQIIFDTGFNLNNFHYLPIPTPDTSSSSSSSSSPFSRCIAMAHNIISQQCFHDNNDDNE